MRLFYLTMGLTMMAMGAVFYASRSSFPVFADVFFALAVFTGGLSMGFAGVYSPRRRGGHGEL